MKEFNYDGLIHSVPVTEGATVDVVSDLFNIIKQCMKNGEKFEINTFIDALCHAVGPEGTVLIRTFSWDFCHGLGFDMRKTVSQAGALGNVALARPDFRRTQHPIYSWMVWGKYKDYLCSLKEKEAFGGNSVFAWEAACDDAIQINLGSPKTNGLTLFHYVEELVGVPYRYIKEFTDIYTDENGESSRQTYSMYVRDLDYEIITKDSVYMPLLEERGIKANGEYMGIFAESYRIKDLCKIYEEDFRRHKIPTGVTVSPIKKDR